MGEILPIGKLPQELLLHILESNPVNDPKILLGPGIGLDCAVIDIGNSLLVLKSDPITFTSKDIGWYLVHVNANDIATTGARPRWMLVTCLLPEKQTTVGMIEQIQESVINACQALDITIVGGHTEITQGLDRPIIIGTLIGEVTRQRLVTPLGVQPGDRILLTKCVPIEATSIIAREFTSELMPTIGEEEIREAKEYLLRPGISVVQDAEIATRAGNVTGMHDPTEGGIKSALWEFAIASKQHFAVDVHKIPVTTLSKRICSLMNIDPLGAISSGALLLTTPPHEATTIQISLQEAGIQCTDIGYTFESKKDIETEHPSVWQDTPTGRQLLPNPQYDEIAGLQARYHKAG